MSVYEAIMKAAEHIENHPKDFNYGSVCVPGECGSPGCAVGWIGYFSNTNRGRFGLSEVCREALGLLPELLYCGGTVSSYGAFENRMHQLAPGWAFNAASCAKALRLYAAKYHAPAKPPKPTQKLVADLMRKITTERIPEDA
jgi:hypothetical protein